MLIIILLLLASLHFTAGWWRAVVLAGAVGLELASEAFWAWYTRRFPIAVGAEAMVGREVIALSPCRPYGRVSFGVEQWRARCREGAGAGEPLVIEAVDQLTLVVRPAR